MTAPNYRGIEELLVRLLELLRAVLSQSERGEVFEFIDVGEYGLALDTLVDLIVEEDKRISSAAYALLLEMARTMSLNERTYREKLDGKVEE